jgi:DDE superfamily endonuclease
MEDVLDLYQQPRDPRRPLVCMDEQCKQLVREVRPPRRSMPGRPTRIDYEYERAGTANVFLFVAPLEHRRHVDVTQRRTAVDWAHQVRRLVDVHYPDAKKIRLVMDNLNTHTVASLYAAFPPDEARRIARKLDIHHTPKHGSWLNIAEIELSALTRQCLRRRIPDLASMRRDVATWEAHRNAAKVGVNWRFTTHDARIKLRTLYPQSEA